MNNSSALRPLPLCLALAALAMSGSAFALEQAQSTFGAKAATAANAGNPYLQPALKRGEPATTLRPAAASILAPAAATPWGRPGLKDAIEARPGATTLDTAPTNPNKVRANSPRTFKPEAASMGPPKIGAVIGAPLAAAAAVVNQMDIVRSDIVRSEQQGQSGAQFREKGPSIAQPKASSGAYRCVGKNC